MKRVNTRIQTMTLHCLGHSDNNENDNQDFIDDSRPSSPMQLSSDLLDKRRKFSMHGVVNNLNENTTCKGADEAISDTNMCAKLLSGFAEMSKCTLSTPLSPTASLVKENDTVSSTICAVDTESASEKSIEPPPYSPLTPRPVIAKSNDFAGLGAPNNSTNALVTSRCLTETFANKSVSPLPPMSPETESLYHVLANSMDNNYNLNTEDAPETTFIASLRSGEAHLFIDSDDSVRDPDYCANADCDSTDNSSNDSISLISGTAQVEINQIPNRIKKIVSHQSEPVSLESHHTIQEIAQIDNEMPSILQSDIICDSGNANNGRSVAGAVSVHEIESVITEKQPMGRPKKGRKSVCGGLSREERKKRKYANLSYVNSRKKIVSPKTFIDFKCSCYKKCHENISVEKRLAQFNMFYSLASYNAQNMFLAASVKEQPVKRHYIATNNRTEDSKKKNFSRQYRLDGVTVCRDMFIKTLQTSAKRVNTTLYKMRSNRCITDNRGVNSGRNRASPESEEFLINLIKRLPTYISHYRREKTEEAKFLRADMTLSKIYELYKDEAKTAGVKILSASTVNKIFFTKCNLRTKPLKKDTCSKCDFFESQIHVSSGQNRVDIEEKRLAHQEIAEALQKQLRADIKLAKDDPAVETLTFDLQKTLPLPRIPTNIVFYKRQLWVYNLGIHTGSKDEPHCNVWVEGEAGRGAQEVGSCLMKHITERLDGNVKYLILWSDSCGGQNRNIKLVLMLKAMLNEHPTLDQINLKFLESGHSFLPNDTDFGKIECALKHQQRLYTPDDYIQIMRTCKKVKPMQVHRMKAEDFKSSVKLEKNIINRKKTMDGEKVTWLQTKEIMIRRDETHKIYMRKGFNEEFKVVDITKKYRGSQLNISKALMEPLWPSGKPVPEAKLNDLKSMLHLIPKDAHAFYTKLVGNGHINDDLEGFSGQPDFNIESFDLDLE